MRALYTAVSGLTNHQTRMDVIGNNIANVNTTGFKSSRVTFADTLSQTLMGASSANGNVGGTDAQQVGLGMKVSSIDTDFTHGSASSTGNNTDLAINTDAGLFIVKNGNDTYYTRNGNFALDDEGNLVMNGSGLHVQGWNGVNGSVNPNGATENLKIDKDSTMQPKATSNVNYTGNLSADDEEAEISGIKVIYTDGTSENVTGAYAPASTTKAVLKGKSGKSYSILNANGGSIDNDGNYIGTVINNKNLQSITATGSPIEVYFNTSATGIKGGTVTLNSSGPYQETSGTYEVNGKTRVDFGTITKVDPISSTDFKITTDKGVFTVSNAPAGAYKVGDSFSVQATVISGDTNGNPAILNFEDGSNIDLADVPSAAAGKYNLDASTTITAQKSDGLDGTINLVNTYNGKEVKSLSLTMKDGTTQTGFPDETYSEGQSSYPVQTTTATIYDSLGAAHKIPVYIQKTDADKWTLKVPSGLYDGAQVGAVSQDIEFDGTNGKLSSGGSFNINLSIPYPNGAMMNQITGVNLDLTQYSGENTATSSSDGYAAGFYKDMSIGSDGIITLTYTNGEKQEGGQIAIANFNNPAGLSKEGGSLYASSNNSGAAKVGTFAANGVTVTPAALEMSNVNTAQQFSDMIVTQRGFQANSKIITVSDEMLETLVNMKR